MVAGEAATMSQMNRDVEIISLFARPTCSKPLDIPIENSLSMYGAIIGGQPLICGSSGLANDCYTYQIKHSKWQHKNYTLAEERIHAASAMFGDGMWIIMGGQTFVGDNPILLDTSEVFHNLNTFTSGPTLPIPLSSHCAVELGKFQLFIAGGYGDEHLKDTFVLNLDKFPSWSWNNLTSMRYGRFGHTCGKVITFFGDTEVIVAGGLYQDIIEIYSVARSMWFKGPLIENRKIFKAAAIQGELTFVVTGGVELEPDCTTSNCRLNEINVYDIIDNSLKYINQTLRKRRGNHISILLQSDLDCSSRSCQTKPFSIQISNIL